MRVLCVPEPVPLRDAFTDAPSGAMCSFAEFSRALFLHPHIAQMGDVLTLMDLRSRVATAAAGATIELDEQAWQTLVTLARQPLGITPANLPAIVPFVRAIVDAQVK